MIIQFGYRDKQFIELARVLESCYPEDLVQSDSFSLLDDEGHSLTEKDGRPVERISFFSHGSLRRYGKLTADEFSSQLIDSLRAADTRKPGSSAQIKTIDLIGCTIGLIKPDHESVSMVIARRLHEAGYPIQVNSFTNMTHSDPHEVSNFFLTTDMKSYTTFVLPTEEALTAFNAFMKEVAEHGKGMEQQAIFLVENRRELKRCTAALDKGGFAEGAGALRTRIRELKEEIQRNKLAIDHHEDCAIDLRDKAFKCGIALAKTDDPRAYLDTEPQCNFTMRVAHGLGEEKGLNHRVSRAAQKGDVDALSRALAKNPALLNMPGSSGATPLFSAIFNGRFDCVKVLLAAGANSELAPAVNIEKLFRLLNPSECDAAREVLRAKYGEPILRTTVQISPAEIAQIRGYERISRLLTAPSSAACVGESVSAAAGDSLRDPATRMRGELFAAKAEAAGAAKVEAAGAAFTLPSIFTRR
jgi:hypothetical protein